MIFQAAKTTTVTQGLTNGFQKEFPEFVTDSQRPFIPMSTAYRCWNTYKT